MTPHDDAAIVAAPLGARNAVRSRCDAGRSTCSHFTCGDPVTRPHGVGTVLIALHGGVMLAAKSADVINAHFREAGAGMCNSKKKQSRLLGDETQSTPLPILVRTALQLKKKTRKHF